MGNAMTAYNNNKTAEYSNNSQTNVSFCNNRVSLAYTNIFCMARPRIWPPSSWLSTLLHINWWRPYVRIRMDNQGSGTSWQAKRVLPLNRILCDKKWKKKRIGHVNEYPTMHHFGISRYTQSMVAYTILTEYFWKFQWNIALWECS